MAQQPADPPSQGRAESDAESGFRALGHALRNWARWGSDDQRGTLNFITPERVLAAVLDVSTGAVFELSIPLGGPCPAVSPASRRTKALHLMSLLPDDLELEQGLQVTDDYAVLPLQAGTQWDGLGHVGYDGMFYNGLPTTTISARAGATGNGIERTLPGVVGPAVLLDIARLHGRDWLPASYAIQPADLDAAVSAQAVELRSGDTVLVRTGWREKGLRHGFDLTWNTTGPGLGLATARWLAEHEAAAVASDNWCLEVSPAENPGDVSPLHAVLIRDMGMPIGELFHLADLAAACSADGRWRFLLVAPPLRIDGAVGTPVTPIAIR